MAKNDIRLQDIPLALILLTRLPLPHLAEERFARQAQAAWAFPLAGLAVGSLAAVLGAVALAAGLPALVAAGLMLAAQVLLTGAMHEDGLADTADGLWGGFSRERRLEIMKDSRIGAYGVLALIFGVGLRWMALSTVLAAFGVLPAVALAAMSRAVMPVLMRLMPPARAQGLATSVGRPPLPACLAGIAIALAAGLLLCGAVALWAALAMALAGLGLGLIARAKIGGQTGDILGAAQQLAELAGLLVLAAAAA
jgi:adenosylcobinamide-GDP ribazoletransferase